MFDFVVSDTHFFNVSVERVDYKPVRLSELLDRKIEELERG